MIKDCKKSEYGFVGAHGILLLDGPDQEIHLVCISLS